MQHGIPARFTLRSNFNDASAPSPNREQRFQWIGSTIAVQFAAWPVRFPWSASGLIAIILVKANMRRSRRDEFAASDQESAIMATPYPGNVTPLVPAAPAAA